MAIVALAAAALRPVRASLAQTATLSPTSALPASGGSLDRVDIVTLDW